jgi:hypothetical protein
VKRILLCVVVLALVVGFLARPDESTAGEKITTYVVSAITDKKVLPSTTISSDYQSSRISIAACCGEYEPATFVVRANEAISSLSVTATSLSGAASSIPATAVDIRVVKCWYVAGTEMPYTGTKALVPELLLKDDTLVKVQNGENYLKLTSGKYVWISDPANLAMQYPDLDELPVKDSATLLPVNISSGTNKQFWVTVHVPEDAQAGGYKGKITLATSDGFIGEIDLAVEVLPFKLLSPYLTYSIDYLGVLKDEGSISTYAKNREQYKAEIADIVAHGGGSPILVQPVYLDETDSTSKFVETLTIRANAGISNRNLYYGVPIGYLGYNPSSPTSSTALAALKDKVQDLVSFTKSYGVTQLYIMGVDEAQGTRLSNQITAWKTVESTGAKMWVTGHRVGAGADEGEDNFSLVGDILDVFVCARAPSAAEAALWHGEGNKIWCYAYPMSGGEVPETYRRNYGLLLWQRNYDGALAHYQWKSGVIWNDFDDPGDWKAHVFAYPTMNGSVDTTEWEGWREAIDDVRYLTTLRDAISKAKAKGKSTTAAESWLASLKSSDLTTKDLGTVRSEMIAQILSLDITAPVISTIGGLAASSPSSSITVTWTTDERATSQVEYGTTTDYGSTTALNTDLVIRHSVKLTSLDAGTTYHYRVKSKDAASNVGQSEDRTFTTAEATIEMPSASTDDPGNIAATTVLLYGSLTSLGTADTVGVSFIWGTSAGGPYPNETAAEARTDTGAFNANLDGLAAGTTYYCKAKAAGDDIGYGAEKSFTTSADASVSPDTPAPVVPDAGGDNGTGSGGSDVTCVPGDGGDANGDGMINAADVTVAERIIAGLQEPNAGADVNGDGIVDAADIEGILLACCGVASR